MAEITVNQILRDEKGRFVQGSKHSEEIRMKIRKSVLGKKRLNDFLSRRKK